MDLCRLRFAASATGPATYSCLLFCDHGLQYHSITYDIVEQCQVITSVARGYVLDMYGAPVVLVTCRSVKVFDRNTTSIVQVAAARGYVGRSFFITVAEEHGSRVRWWV